MIEMSEVREISTCLVQATNNFPTKIHLTPWDLQLLLLDTIQKGLLYHKSNTDQEIVLDRLKNSLSRALDFFPPLAGRLAAVDHEDSNTRSFYIDCNNEGAQFTHSVAAGLTVNDILKAKYIPKIVHSFFSLNGFSNIEGISKPLLAVQVTELEDGYFVGCTMNHCVGDGTSFWDFLNSWSEICRGSLFPSIIPSMDRWFSEDVDCPIRVPVLGEESVDVFVPPPLEERCFHFSKEKIFELKQRANSDQTPGTNISSLQAVLAHIWQSVIQCRDRGSDKVSLRLIVNSRRRLSPPLPDSYFGNAVYVLPVTTTASMLLSAGHAWVSAELNRAVAAQTVEETKNSYEKWVKYPVIHRKSVTLMDDGLLISSSPRFNVYGTDFSWGKPAAVRSGAGNKCDGKITLFPGSEPGSMDIEFCLLEGTLQRLENEAEFMHYVQL